MRDVLTAKRIARVSAVGHPIGIENRKAGTDNQRNEETNKYNNRDKWNAICVVIHTGSYPMIPLLCFNAHEAYCILLDWVTLYYYAAVVAVSRSRLLICILENINTLTYFLRYETTCRLTSSDSASRHFSFRSHTLALSFNLQTICIRLLYLCGPSNNFSI